MTRFSIFTDEYTPALMPNNDGPPLAIGNMFYRLGTGIIRCAGMRVFNPHPTYAPGNVTFTAHLSVLTSWDPAGPPYDDLIRQVGGITLPPGQWTEVTWAPFDLAPGVPIWLSYSCPSGDYAYAPKGALGGDVPVKAVGGQPLFLASNAEVAPDQSLRLRAAYKYNAIDLRVVDGPGEYWAGIDLLADDGAPGDAPTSTTAWSLWDGAVEVPLSAPTLWDGTVEVPAHADLVL